MDDYSALLGDEPTPEEQQQAMAAALRRQQLGTLGQLTGDSVLSKVGAGMVQGAQHQEQMLQQARDRGIQHQLLAQRYGDLADLHNQPKVVTTRDGAVALVDRNTGTSTDVRAPVHPLARVGLGGGPGGPGGGKVKESDWKAFFSQLNPSTGRAGELGKNYARANTANRALALVDDGNGGVRDLDKREVPELAITLQNLLSPGGHSTAEVEHLIPSTFQGDIQGFLEKLSNEPQGLGMRAFVEKMKHTIEREKAVSLAAMREAQYGIVPQGSNLYAHDKARFLNSLKGLGLDPALLDEKTLLRREAAAKASAPAAAPEVHMLTADGKRVSIPADKEEEAVRVYKMKRAPNG